MRRLLIIMTAILIMTPIASAQSSSNGAEQELRRIDKDWAAWFTQRGADAQTILNLILADDYTFTSVWGGVFTKAEYLKDPISVVLCTPS